VILVWSWLVVEPAELSEVAENRDVFPDLLGLTVCIGYTLDLWKDVSLLNANFQSRLISSS